MLTSITANFSIDLTGQVALVTGTTSGLGRRFAKVLAACGAKVVLTGRRVERLESLAEEIRGDGGVCEAYAMDMTNRDNVRSVVEKASETLGTISILVNNAGVPDSGQSCSMSEDVIDDVMETNLTGPFILSREVARRLIEKNLPGRIVNISSMAAFDVNTKSGQPLYSVCKGGIVRMTEVLAVEWAKNHINVNGIAPGYFNTELIEPIVDMVGEGMAKGFPRKRICQPEQMDSTLLYLVSPSSECVTGSVIKVDDAQLNR